MRKNNTAGTPSEGLRIDDPRKFAKSCAKALRDALDNDKVFEKKPENLPYSGTKYGFHDTLRGCTAREQENEAVVSVIPLERGIVREVWMPQWLAVNISFMQSEAGALLTSVNLSVFSGMFSDEVKELRFRAEWLLKRDVIEHAQPHWHIHRPPFGRPAAAQPPGAGFASFPAPPRPSFPSASKETVPKNTDSTFTHVHYAMASGWHMGRRASVEDIEQGMICPWLEGCIRYIRSQLQHLRSRA